MKIRKTIKDLISDSKGRASMSRLGYFLTVVTTVFWVNVIFALYVWHAYHGTATPDMPAQIVMVILTLLGGYLGVKGTEAVARWGGPSNGLSGEIRYTNKIGTSENEDFTLPGEGPKGNIPRGNNDL